MEAVKKDSLRAFTLIELVITIAIIAVVSVFVILNLYGRRTSNDYKGTAQEIVALLQEAQSRAQAGTGSTSWGVYFSNPTGTAPFYALFSGVTFSTSTMADRYVLPSDVCYGSLLLGSSTSAVFNPNSGVLNGSSSIDIELQSIARSGCNQSAGATGSNLLGAWLTNKYTSLPSFGYGTLFTGENGYLYVFGGSDATDNMTSTFLYASAKDGYISPWSYTARPPYNIWLFGATFQIHSGYIYSFGGSDNSQNLTSTVYYAPLNGDGTIGAWATSTPLPSDLYDATPLMSNNEVYLLGGCTQITFPSCGGEGIAYYAPLNGDGTIGAWATSTSDAPSAHNGSAIVMGDGYLYDLCFSWCWSTVYYAPLNGDGTIGAWATSTTNLPNLNSIGTVASGGYVYLLGGQDGYSGDETSTVYYAPLNGDGTIGAWGTTTPLPIGPNVYSGDSLTSLVSGGYIYNFNTDGTVYSAPFSSSDSSVIIISPQGSIQG